MGLADAKGLLITIEATTAGLHEATLVDAPHLEENFASRRATAIGTSYSHAERLSSETRIQWIRRSDTFLAASHGNMESSPEPRLVMCP